ncbi:MAG: DDE-type integrase/transposase/recombinase, partial [Pseudomonas amygdali]
MTETKSPGNLATAFDFCALLTSPTDGFLFDTGATVSVCKDRAAFSTLYGQASPPLQGVTGTAACPDTGEITFRRPDGGLFTVANVRYCPTASVNLISGVYFHDRGYSIQYDSDGNGLVSRHGDLAFHLVRRRGEIAKVAATPYNAHASQSLTLAVAPLSLWHQRFNHLNFGMLRSLKKSPDITGLEISVDDCVDHACNSCECAKAHRSACPLSKSREKRKLGLVHSDLLEFPIRSRGGAKWLITFVDDHTRKLWTYPVHRKSDIPDIIARFKAFVENQTSLALKIFRSDHGTEYMNHKVNDLFN